METSSWRFGLNSSSVGLALDPFEVWAGLTASSSLSLLKQKIFVLFCFLKTYLIKYILLSVQNIVTLIQNIKIFDKSILRKRIRPPMENLTVTNTACAKYPHLYKYRMAPELHNLTKARKPMLLRYRNSEKLIRRAYS